MEQSKSRKGSNRRRSWPLVFGTMPDGRDPAILRTEMLDLDPRHSGMAALLAAQSLSDR
jgi:hypothetical protein